MKAFKQQYMQIREENILCPGSYWPETAPTVSKRCPGHCAVQGTKPAVNAGESLHPRCHPHPPPPGLSLPHCPLRLYLRLHLGQLRPTPSCLTLDSSGAFRHHPRRTAFVSFCPPGDPFLPFSLILPFWAEWAKDPPGQEGRRVCCSSHPLGPPPLLEGAKNRQAGKLSSSEPATMAFIWNTLFGGKRYGWL